MRLILLMLTLTVIPLLVSAQHYDDSPMVLVGGRDTLVAKPAVAKENPTPPTTATAQPAVSAKTPPVPPNFPEWAISKAGQNAAGNSNPVPETPASPTPPADGDAPASPAALGHPETPPAPESPAGKLWPKDTVPIFVKSCIGFHVQLIPACTCVITQLMATIPHDEFLKLSETDKIDSDPRYTKARQDCATAPEREE